MICAFLNPQTPNSNCPRSLIPKGPAGFAITSQLQSPPPPSQAPPCLCPLDLSRAVKTPQQCLFSFDGQKSTWEACGNAALESVDLNLTLCLPNKLLVDAVCCCCSVAKHVPLFVTPWTAARRAPLSSKSLSRRNKLSSRVYSNSCPLSQ